jgi:hypothetical protein
MGFLTSAKEEAADLNVLHRHMLPFGPFPVPNPFEEHHSDHGSYLGLTLIFWHLVELLARLFDGNLRRYRGLGGGRLRCCSTRVIV